jgi:predicted MFS family arabinose efflux permease
VTFVGVGFVMAMTAPVELLYAIKIGSSTSVVTLFILISGLGVFFVDVLGTRFVTRIDARAALVAGTVLFAASEAVLGLAQVPEVLLAGRALQGAASALIGGAMLQVSVRLNNRPQHSLGSMQSLQLAGGAMGAPAGGLVASLISGIAGYRIAFAVCGTAGLLVAVTALLILPTLPPTAGSGKPQIGFPQLTVPPVLRLALGLGLFGNFLRSGVENTAFPLIGNAHGLSTAAIGAALGLLSGVEICVLGVSGRIFDRIAPARCLLGALVAGVAVAGLLALDHRVTGFVAAAVLFGLVDGIVLAAPPVLVVALSADASIGVATYRIVCGVGSLIGSGSVNLCIATLGATGGLAIVGVVLIGGAALALVTGQRIIAARC